MEIYGLSDPSTGQLRYVGKTGRSLALRLQKHLNPSHLEGCTHKNSWIKSVLSLGQKPIIHSIQVLDTSEDLNNAEIYWIKFFRDQGCRLTNGTDGGDGSQVGRTFSFETREKIAAAMRGRRSPHSAATKAKISASTKGRKKSPETVANMAAAQFRFNERKRQSSLSAATSSQGSH